MTRRALITGAAGQDGTYLTELLLAKGYSVFAMPGPVSPDYTGWASERGSGLRVLDGDITKIDSLTEVVSEAEPDEVYNFAALSSVGKSWERDIEVADVNALGVVRLLKVLRTVAPSARYCQASSADIFGSAEDLLQDESTPIRPQSPYGASKAYAHFVTANHRTAQRAFACNAILFNHESPRRPDDFVTRKVTQAAARIRLGLAHELRLGDLDARRDWGFAGDYVEAMWLMLQAEVPDDYVVATGEAHSVRELCEIAFGHVDLKYESYVDVDPNWERPNDPRELRGDASKAKHVLGWEPKVSFRQLIEMMVDADLERLRAQV